MAGDVYVRLGYLGRAAVSGVHHGQLRPVVSPATVDLLGGRSRGRLGVSVRPRVYRPRTTRSTRDSRPALDRTDRRHRTRVYESGSVLLCDLRTGPDEADRRFRRDRARVRASHRLFVHPPDRVYADDRRNAVQFEVTVPRAVGQSPRRDGIYVGDERDDRLRFGRDLPDADRIHRRGDAVRGRHHPLPVDRYRSDRAGSRPRHRLRRRLRSRQGRPADRPESGRTDAPRGHRVVSDRRGRRVAIFRLPDVTRRVSSTDGVQDRRRTRIRTRRRSLSRTDDADRGRSRSTRRLAPDRPRHHGSKAPGSSVTAPERASRTVRRCRLPRPSKPAERGGRLSRVSSPRRRPPVVSRRDRTGSRPDGGDHRGRPHAGSRRRGRLRSGAGCGRGSRQASLGECRDRRRHAAEYYRRNGSRRRRPDDAAAREPVSERGRTRRARRVGSERCDRAATPGRRHPGRGF